MAPIVAFLTKHWKVLTGAFVSLVAVTVAFLRGYHKGKGSGLAISEDAIRRHEASISARKLQPRAPLPSRVEAPSMPSDEDLDKLHDEVNKL